LRVSGVHEVCKFPKNRHTGSAGMTDEDAKAKWE
jgi:hypothetical protein